MLLKNGTLELSEGKHGDLRRASLYGEDVAVFIDANYPDIKDAFAAHGTIDLDSHPNGGVVKALTKAIEYRLDMALRDYDKKNLKRMIADGMVQFSPEKLGRIKAVLSASDAYNRFAERTGQLHEKNKAEIEKYPDASAAFSRALSPEGDEAGCGTVRRQGR